MGKLMTQISQSKKKKTNILNFFCCLFVCLSRFFMNASHHSTIDREHFKTIS
jgi:hypothetical protein